MVLSFVECHFQRPRTKHLPPTATSAGAVRERRKNKKRDEENLQGRELLEEVRERREVVPAEVQLPQGDGAGQVARHLAALFRAHADAGPRDAFVGKENTVCTTENACFEAFFRVNALTR